MVKRKRNRKVQTEEVEIPIEELSPEDFKLLIANGVIDEELPFELLATHFPDLLSEWYPGYPGKPRMMTENDPMCVRGCIKKGMLTICDIPGLQDFPFPLEDEIPLEGEYEVWIRREEDGAWFVHIVVDDKDKDTPTKKEVATALEIL